MPTLRQAMQRSNQYLAHCTTCANNNQPLPTYGQYLATYSPPVSANHNTTG